ncbi:MAG: exodeoxyribonuclease VII small subunit [Actinomycetota bacterium]|nr:exodeoxyribonuclease VII small subunit [Actinomycetota bacterium]
MTEDVTAGMTGGVTEGAPAGDEASRSFEELVEELEDLTRRMADGDIGIEEAVELYEQAGRLHDLAAERLARVRERIERLGPTKPA